MAENTAPTDLTWGEKITALRRVASYRPLFTAGLIILGGFVAALEGVGLRFIHPIIEVAQADGPVEGGGPVLETFLAVYEFLGIPFELGFLLVGVTAVMTIRYTLSFLVAWVNYPTLLLRRIRASVLERGALMWTPGDQSLAIDR